MVQTPHLTAEGTGLIHDQGSKILQDTRQALSSKKKVQKFKLRNFKDLIEVE